MNVKDIDRTPVAKDIITICSKCKLELNHVVIRHNSEGIVERVKCHTCGSEHRYSPRNKKKSSAASKPKAKTKKRNTGEDFNALLEKHRDKASIPYNMKASFNVEDVIEHKTFGTGIITGVSFQRIEVIFSDGPRLLAADK